MEAVWLYAMQEWGVERTNRYIDDLIAAFEFLAGSPKAGPQCANLRPGYRKYPVIRHVAHHRETSYGIEIVRVLHDRMLASRRF